MVATRKKGRVRVRDHRTKSQASARPARRRPPVRSHNQDQRLAEKMAPLLKLHPKEKAFPMDPMAFIRMSRFRQHRSRARDKGYNKVSKSWKTTNSKDRSKYLNIPVEVISSYGADSKGRLRRPRDKRSKGVDRQVFLQAHGSLRGVSSPTGRVPAYWYVRHVGTRSTNSQRTLLSYWYFFGDNPTPPLAHQGDWVHATLSILPSGKLEAIWFSRHGIKPVKVLRKDLLFHRGRPLIYISKASHGNWPRPGTYRFERTPNFVSKVLKKAGFADQCSDGGVTWDLSKKLLPLKTQPWRNYAGAWGEVGEFKETTGPLGPWHKRTGK